MMWKLISGYPRPIAESGKLFCPEVESHTPCAFAIGSPRGSDEGTQGIGVNGKVKVYQLWELKSVPPLPLMVRFHSGKAVMFSPPLG